MIAALAALALAAGAEPPAQVFLGQVPVEADAAAIAALARGAPVALELALAPAAAARWRGSELAARTGARVEGARALLRLADYPAAAEAPGPADLAASFMIDLDEPPVQALRAPLQAAAGDRPRAGAVARFAGAHVARKNLTRGWDLASRVAARGEGDCTEHAVLTAALARLAGLPARVVIGLVLVPAGDRALALGHAWDEVYEDGAWRLVDATGLAPLAPRYLPLARLRDEGPSFTLGMLDQPSPLDVVGLRLAAAAAP